jgi:hypothetical protein
VGDSQGNGSGVNAQQSYTTLIGNLTRKQDRSSIDLVMAEKFNGKQSLGNRILAETIVRNRQQAHLPADMKVPHAFNKILQNNESMRDHNEKRLREQQSKLHYE